MEPLKDNSKRARILISVFWLICGLNIIAIISGYFEIKLLESMQSGTSVSSSEADMNDLRQAIIGMTQFAAFILCVVVFLNWFRRAYGNLHRIAPHVPEHSEKTAVWSFFVPILNLFRPYTIMKEIWLKSQRQILERKEDFIVNTSTALIGLWWALYLVSSFVSNFAGRSVLRAETVDDYLLSSQAYFISDIIEIPAALTAILVVWKVSAIETTLFKIQREAPEISDVPLTSGGQPKGQL